MTYTPISPFMRPMTLACLQGTGRKAPGGPAAAVSKWDVLRDLSKAQAAFGVSERDLTVLQGLLSFFPDTALGGQADMVVFPSNKAICERLNGMACSTMRRHLARLVACGLIGRRDSPNGKRYSRKHGEERVAFGFDLTPLWTRAPEIAQAAEAVRAAEMRIRQLRETVSLMRRDLAALAAFGEAMRPGLGLWDALRDRALLTARALRRKLTPEDLATCKAELEGLLTEARQVVEPCETADLNTSAAQSGQHHQNSMTESLDKEPHREDHASGNGAAMADPAGTTPEPGATPRHTPARVPLPLVVAGCPALKTFYQGGVHDWHQLFDAASRVRPAMGISAAAWAEAQRAMGRDQAAVVVVAMLERFGAIRSPNGYLRRLAAKAREGVFSCGPMVMALLARRATA